MKSIKKTMLACAALGVLSATPVMASSDDIKPVSFKGMVGINKYEADYGNASQSVVQEEDLYGLGLAVKYDFTPIFGTELRYYIGGEEKYFESDSFEVEASLEMAGTLMLTAQTPELFGVRAYVQAGPAFVKNSIGGRDLSKQSIAYGGGIEYSIDESRVLFIDALQFSNSEFSMNLDDETAISGVLKNRIISLGFMMKF
jgi:opacity protein-like surface antigen